MSLETIAGVALAAIALIYLLFALLRPEDL